MRVCDMAADYNMRIRAPGAGNLKTARAPKARLGQNR